MIRFSFAKDLPSLLKAAVGELAIVAPAAMWTKRRLPRQLDKKLKDLAIDMAEDVKPGDLGGTGKTLTGGKPRRLSIGVLPDAPSRYNCPARAESIFKAVSALDLARAKKAGLILILDDAAHATAAANAVGRAFPMFTNKTGDRADARLHLLALDTKGTVVPIDRVARETMTATREAARLVDTPPTVMNPEQLASEIQALVGDTARVRVKTITGPALLRAGLRGVHAVGRCAVKAPRVVVATYTPSRRKAIGPHVALVGKGVTYDTGGLHIKGRGGMETMKGDMGGAAAVTGAFRVLSRTGAKQRVSLVVCLAENAIGPEAYKPDDIIEMHSGKTVEINNTDAEGRLLLADGVSYAVRVLGAQCVLDAATLTGAQMIATGHLHAAVMSNEEAIEEALVTAGRRSGDLVHPLPFAPEFYKAEFKSPIADMRNSVKNRLNAQSSCAGQFIYNHVEDTDVQWGHVDMAGPSFRHDRGTGFGVALLADVVAKME